MKIKVHELFQSVSGEVGKIAQGAITTFLRLDGCNLRCSWCDTKNTRKGDHHRNLDLGSVAAMIRELGSPNLIITGGEPLLQWESLVSLIRDYLRRSVRLIQVETNGSIILPGDLLPWVGSWVVDYKLRSSGQTEQMLPIRKFVDIPRDSWVKFVVASPEDLVQLRVVLNRIRQHVGPCYQLKYAFTPTGEITANRLMKWMIKERVLDGILNVQIHKVAGISEPGVR